MREVGLPNRRTASGREHSTKLTPNIHNIDELHF